MKTIFFGLIVLGTLLVVPAYADCGSTNGYAPFVVSVEGGVDKDSESTKG